MIRYREILAGALLACALLVMPVTAQPLGTFRWQLQPFCNVVTVAITQNGAVYRLEGTDDQCGNGADAASVTGTAFANADGTIGFGLNVVTTPGGRPLHVDAEITTGSFSGTWRDSAGASGTFAFTPGAGSGGSPRPLPAAGVPPAFQLRSDGGFAAGGVADVGSIPASGPGVRMMWYPAKGAFRAGQAVTTEWDDPNVGFGSVAFGKSALASGAFSTAMGAGTEAIGVLSTAMGNNTMASGVFSTTMGSNTTASSSGSTAMGSSTTASGPNSLAVGSSTRASASSSTAMGSSTTADGPNSLAIGSSTRASGSSSTAMGSSTTADGPDGLAIGSRTRASGSSSTAMGSSTTASGPNSLAGGSGSVAIGSNALAFGSGARVNGASGVALGTNAVASGNGSFAFADSSAATSIVAGPNQFLVRAAGGVEFYSNAAATLGVRLAPNSTQFGSLSDVRAKHRFRELDGDDVLAKIAQMPVAEWSYKAQDSAIRHIGPTAQDFHAAFGLGEDPLRIGTLDADGVALAGVKALEARSRQHRTEHDDDIATLRAEIAGLRALVATLMASPQR